MIFRAISIFTVSLFTAGEISLAPAQSPPPPVASVGQEADQAAAQALALLNSGKTKEAEDAYSAIIQRYPTAGVVPEALYRLGYIRYLLGEYPQAIATLARVQSSPAAPEIKAAASSLLPQILSTQAGKLAPGDPKRTRGFEDAISQFNSFLQKYPQSQDVEFANYGRAMAAYQIQDFDAAIKSLRDNLTRFPTSGSVLDSEDLLAVVLTAQGAAMLRAHGDQAAAFAKFDEALKYLADIIERHSDIALANDAQFQIGEVLFDRGNFEAPDKRATTLGYAIEAYRAVQPKEPMIQAQQDRLAAILRQIQAAVLSRNPALVRELQGLQDRENAKLQTLNQAPDQTINAQLRIAACYVLMQKFDEARVLLQYLQPFVQDEEQKKQVLYYITLTYASQGLMDKAVADYNEFQSKYKGDPLGENLPVAMGSGFLNPKSNRPGDAIKYFDEEARLYPKSPLVNGALSEEAAALVGLRRFDEALRAYQRFLQTNPPKEQAVGAEEGIAMVYQQTNKLPDAIKQYRKVADTYPGTPQAEQSAYYAARLKLASGDAKGGLADLQAFVKKYPAGQYTAEATMTIGQAQSSLGDKAAAIQTFKDTIAKFPKTPYGPQAYFQEAIILGGEQKTDQMLGVMHDFIAAYPDSKDIFYAYDTIGQTQISQGKIAAAVATYTEMAEKHPNNPMASTSLYRAADLWRKTAESQGHYLALNQQQRADWNKDVASSLEAGEKMLQQYPDSDAAGLALKTLLDDQKLLLGAQQKTPADVEKYFQGLASKFASNPSAKSRILFTLATYLYESDKSKAVAQMAAAYNPGLVYAPEDLDLYGAALIDQGKPDVAYRIYEKIAKDYPNPPNVSPAQATPAIQEAQATALFGMAHALDKEGKTTEAGKLYTQLKALYPWSPKVIEANFGIAQSLYQQKKTDDAMKLLLGVVNARTASPELRARAFLLVGQIDEEKGNIPAAIDSYLKIATYYAGVPEAAAEGLWKGGQLLEQQAAGLTEQSTPKKSEQIGKARGAYQDLVNKYPNSEYAPKANQRLQSLG